MSEKRKRTKKASAAAKPGVAAATEEFLEDANMLVVGIEALVLSAFALTLLMGSVFAILEINEYTRVTKGTIMQKVGHCGLLGAKSQKPCLYEVAYRARTDEYKDSVITPQNEDEQVSAEELKRSVAIVAAVESSVNHEVGATVPVYYRPDEPAAAIIDAPTQLSARETAAAFAVMVLLYAYFNWRFTRAFPFASMLVGVAMFALFAYRMVYGDPRKGVPTQSVGGTPAPSGGFDNAVTPTEVFITTPTDDAGSRQSGASFVPGTRPYYPYKYVSTMFPNGCNVGADVDGVELQSSGVMASRRVKRGAFRQQV